MQLLYDIDLNGFEDKAVFKLDDYVDTSAIQRQPKWYQDVTLFINNCRNKKEYIANCFNNLVESHPMSTPKTAKGCPGYINFFKQSISFKTAADIYINVFYGDFDLQYRWSTADPFWTIDNHRDDQCGGLAERALVLKFDSPFVWAPSEDTQFFFVDPFIKNDVPYRVSPGIIHQPKNTIGTLNIPLFFPRGEGQYVIEKGTTIAYLHFDKPVRSVKRADLKDKTKEFRHTTLVKKDHNALLGKR